MARMIAAPSPQRMRLANSGTLVCFQRASAPKPIINTTNAISGTNTASK